MVRHLGFEIPLAVTLRHDTLDRVPQRGRCYECGQKRDRVFAVGADRRPYCAECIAFDLACADPSDEMKREQKHPPTSPIETMYEKSKDILDDDFSLRAIVPGPHPDPRIYDKALE